MSILASIPIPLPILAYAETHYRFRFLPSLLRKKEPEIVFDAPHRVGPGSSIPIVVCVKDAHTFPAKLMNATVRLAQNVTHIREETLVHQQISLTDEWWWTVFTVDPGDLHGWITCDIRFTIEIDGKQRTYATNNYRTASHAPLRIFRSKDPLPTLPGFLHGETHAHSSYTSDQVEYGLPLLPARTLCRSMGLDFFAITDHSYDLDDDLSSYLVNDPQLKKWGMFQAEVDELNADSHGPVILRGEEVTVRNASGSNVHCLVYGDRTFHPGSGDSAERWFRTRSELDIPELLSRTADTAGVFGAHIAEEVPWIQKVLLGRGSWTFDDLHHGRLDGVQFWNGMRGDGMERGKELWIRQLLNGMRSTAIAGNDAHGNFNRFLQLKVPFLFLHDLDKQLFGRVRTAVYSETIDENTILTALRQGRSVLTDGPIVACYRPDGRLLTGERSGAGEDLIVRASSTPEFGVIDRIQLIAGHRGSTKESSVAEFKPNAYNFTSEALSLSENMLYARLELHTKGGQAYARNHMALSNPVYGPGGS